MLFTSSDIFLSSFTTRYYRDVSPRARQLTDVALFRHFPALDHKLAWFRLGDWPTPVARAPKLDRYDCEVYIKREDLASPIYGGNKVRTLEAMFGLSQRNGRRGIWATGAYGSNHTTATLLHARQHRLPCGALLFPQPRSQPALDNLRAMLSTQAPLVPLAHLLQLPRAIRARRQRGDFVMLPGGRVPHGCLGALSAMLELGEQIQRGELPIPRSIVVAVGSGCTTAGLVAGLALARKYNVGFTNNAPTDIYAVRVTPWPVTSHFILCNLAARTLRYLADKAASTRDSVPEIPSAELGKTLTIVTDQLGAGYGETTTNGVVAMQVFRDAGGPITDEVYSAKSAAACLALRKKVRGPLLFWATKSGVPLPNATAEQLALAPRRLLAWHRAD